MFIRVIFLFICIIQTSNYTYAQLTKKILNSPFQHSEINVGNIGKDHYDLTKLLPKNYVKDGSVDYTKYLMIGIKKYAKVKMPNFPVLTSGLVLKSNSSIYFQEKSRLILIPNSKERYQILCLHGIENVKIYNPNLLGDRLKHKSNKGEWGFGIDIRKSRNVEIYNANISNCWGDGIIITESSLGNFKQTFQIGNIKIYNPKLEYNRRNGITITGGTDILIKGATIINNFGTAPQAGIDIEPDNYSAKLENIEIYDTKMFNVDKGLVIVLNKFLNTKIDKYVNITVNNLTVYNSTYGILFQKFENSNIKFRKLLGNIIVDKYSNRNNSHNIYKISMPNYPKLNINKKDYNF